MNQRDRLAINVITNYATFMLYGVANFILVGYVVRRLGSDAFGLVSLILSLAVVTDLLGTGICQALTKHLAASVDKSDHKNDNAMVNTSLLWFTICGLIGGGIVALLGVHIERLFQIPPELVKISQVAMLLMAIKIFICFPFSTFQGILWAHQRYDLTNLSRLVAILLRVIGIIAYFELVKPGIIELIVISVISFVAERILWTIFSIRVSEKFYFGFSFISLKALIILVSFGGFMLIIHVANLLGYEAVKWVIGLELSVLDVGGYTLIATLAAFAGSLVRSIANILMPAASRLHALEQYEANTKLAFLSTKYAMIVSSGLCIMPVFLLKPFLTLWVGTKYSQEYLGDLALAGAVLLIGQWFITTAVCILQMLTGVGRIKFPAIVTFSWAVGGLAGVWIYLHWIQNSLLAVVIGITIARVIGSVIHLIYGMAMLQLQKTRFLMEAIVKPAITGIIGCVFCWSLSYYLDIYQLKWFLPVGFIVVGVYSLVIWVLVLGSHERAEIFGKARLVINRLKQDSLP